MVVGEFVAEEDVCGLDVPVDDAGPASGRDVGLLFEAIVSVMQKRDRVRQLHETAPEELFRTPSLSGSGPVVFQVPAFAVFEIQR